MKSKGQVITFAPSPKPKGWKKACGYIGIDANGTVFLPWFYAPSSEMDVFLCASYDGESFMLADRKTWMVRADWLKENYPIAADVIEKAVYYVRSLLNQKTD
jgi:hypothetical protein